MRTFVAPELQRVTQTEQAKLEARQREAQQSVIDLTRNIQHKKDQELAQLQFNGNGTSSTPSRRKPLRRLAATTCAPAGAERNTRNVTALANFIVAAPPLPVSSSARCSRRYSALWKEYRLSSITQQGNTGNPTYTPNNRHAKISPAPWASGSGSDRPHPRPVLSPLCARRPRERTIISDDNYVIVFDSPKPRKADVDAVIRSLPNRKDTSLPALLTFLPRDGLVPGSGRYILGNASLAAFAPELSSANPGFEQGAEAQSAAYTLPGNTSPVRLVLF